MDDEDVFDHRDAAVADADLVLRTRSGDPAAFGELWRRHYRSGITVARNMTSSLDADDLVQEAYTRIFQSITAGGGPTGSFRAYLFASIRNTAAAWGRARRETTGDELEDVEDPRSGAHATEAALDRSLTHTAFRRLPTRWQEALWYSEIEQLKPAEIAPLLGLTPTAVAQLTFRAREGLREAWIQAHLQSVEDGSQCQWTIERLGSYTRQNIGRRDHGKVEAHIAGCVRCSIVASEAKEVSSRLALVLLPLTIGAAGASAYLATLQGGGSTLVALAAGASAPMPAAVVAPAVVAPAVVAPGVVAPGVVAPAVVAPAVVAPGAAFLSGAGLAGPAAAGTAAGAAAASGVAAATTVGAASSLAALGAVTSLAAAGLVVVGAATAAVVLPPAAPAPAPGQTVTSVPAHGGDAGTAPSHPNGPRPADIPTLSDPPGRGAGAHDSDTAGEDRTGAAKTDAATDASGSTSAGGTGNGHGSSNGTTGHGQGSTGNGTTGNGQDSSNGQGTNNGTPGNSQSTNNGTPGNSQSTNNDTPGNSQSTTGNGQGTNNGQDSSNGTTGNGQGTSNGQGRGNSQGTDRDNGSG